MDKKDKCQIVFDVVNSVKGGSGKSTIALQLAALLAARNDTDAFIIDLDLRGTSWKTTYEKNYSSNDEGNQYINNMMYGFESEDALFWHLPVECVNFVTQRPSWSNVQLCIADPSFNSDMDDLKVDLLESTVYDIIEKIIERRKSQKEIHIILDMPPSYERHAERVVKHLLMDKGSSLFKRYYNEKEDEIKYRINFFMIYAIAPSHIDQNIRYITNFLKNLDYSSALPVFLDHDTFSIYFVGNDVSGVIGEENKPGNIYNIIHHMKSSLKLITVGNEFSGATKRMREKLHVIEHMDLGKDLRLFPVSNEPTTLKLWDEARVVLEELFPVRSGDK